MIGQKTSVADVGGVEGHVAHLAAGLAERGHEVTVFTRSRYGAPPPGDVDIRQRWCLPLKHFEGMSHSAVCSFEALASGFDIVHYHGSRSRADRAGVGPAPTHDRLRDGPRSGLQQAQVVAVRSLLAAGRREDRLRASRPGDRGRSLSRSDRCSPHTTASRATSQTGTSRSRACLERSVLAAHGLEPRRYLLFLARLVPEKGADVLIEAVRRGTDTPYRVAIVGGDSHSTTYAASLHHLAAGNSRFVFLGHQSGDALAEIRANACHYVMPSFQEGLPLSLLEALSAGLSVIASDIPAVSEINGTVSPERITLVPPGDAVALAEAIDNLPYPAEPPSDEGIAWPSWDEVAEEVERVYLGGRARGSRRRAVRGRLRPQRTRRPHRRRRRRSASIPPPTASRSMVVPPICPAVPSRRRLRRQCHRRERRRELHRPPRGPPGGYCGPPGPRTETRRARPPPPPRCPARCAPTEVTSSNSGRSNIHITAHVHQGAGQQLQ